MSKKNNNSLFSKIFFVIIGIIVAVALYSYLHPKEKKEISFICNENNSKIKIGETRKINYDINDEIEIEWVSSNDVVTISNDSITANKYGQAIITGIVNDGTNMITSTCTVTTYTGDIGVSIQSINVDDGYLLIKDNSSFPSPFSITPTNAYIESIEYYSNDENIAFFEGNNIISKNSGSAILSFVVNNEISKDLNVIVANDAKKNGIVKKIENVLFKEQNLTLTVGDTKELKYTINPQDGYINSINWFSSNDNVVSVNNGVVKAISSGIATISVTINNSIKSSITIVVNPKIVVTPSPSPKPTATPKTSNEQIVIEKKPKETIKVGETTNIKARIVPSSSKRTIKFISNNKNVATVDQKGVIKGVSPGTTTITVSIGNKNAKYIKIKVTSNSEKSSNARYSWGYSTPNDIIPVFAGASFFQNLASKGRGSFDGSTYNISANGASFSYNLSSSVLTINGGRSILLRIYYPPETDLSSANTLVYLGGDGEADFNNYFASIHATPSIIKSKGIVMLVAQGRGMAFDGDSAIAATRFVQVITNQKSGVKNSVLGFSTGGKFVLEAANKYNYYKSIIFSSWCPETSSLVNAKNRDIMYFLPFGDSLYRLGKDSLVELKNYGYKKVTLVTNSEELLNMFNGSGFNIVNPGSGMKTTHASSNVGSSGVISYAND